MRKCPDNLFQMLFIVFIIWAVGFGGCRDCLNDVLIPSAIYVLALPVQFVWDAAFLFAI